MKYIAIVDDNFISNFRRDDEDGLTLVVGDKDGLTRAVRIKPIIRYTLVLEDGQSIYLTQDHIDALLAFEKDRITKEVIDDFMKGFHGVINGGKVVPDNLQGWRYEE